MALNGYIKLHRKMLEWGWYANPVVKAVFLHLLLTANITDSERHGVALKRGETLVGSLATSALLGISRQQFRTAISKLKATNEITTRATNKYTVVTIVKYEDYQPAEDLPTTKATTTAKKNQPRSKKNKKDNNIYCPFFVSFWDLYPRKVGKPKAALAFKNLMVDDQLLQTMLAALEKQKKSRQWQDPQYIPYPATWLNQRRWEDEVAEQDDTEQRYKFRN